MSPAPRAARARPGGCGYLEVRQVWASSLDVEFELLADAAADEAGTILALDTEFPGFLLHDNGTVAEFERYRILRENVDTLRLIQLGLAVAGPDGVLRGAWSFNLKFDVAVDIHSETSVNFLRAAGLDFSRHAAEGIDPAVLGRLLAASPLVGWSWSGGPSSPPCWSRAPLWVTFSGDYDLGFLLKLLTSGRRLPASRQTFGEEIGAYCPRRLELRDRLPRGSLEKLAKACGIRRFGAAHTAGSDALLTLGLYLHVSSFQQAGFDGWPDSCWPPQDLQGAWAAGGYFAGWQELCAPQPWPLVPAAADAPPLALPLPVRRPQATPAEATSRSPSPARGSGGAESSEAESWPPSPVQGTCSAAGSEAPGVACGAPGTRQPAQTPAVASGAAEAKAPEAPGVACGASGTRQPAQTPAVASGAAEAKALEAGACRAPGHLAGIAALLRAGVCGCPGSLAPPPILCLLHLALLSLVFPPSLDTMLFLPLQVAIVFLLCCSGLVPRPPHNFLSAYLCGSCARLLAAGFWMAWEYRREVLAAGGGDLWAFR